MLLNKWQVEAVIRHVIEELELLAGVRHPIAYALLKYLEPRVGALVGRWFEKQTAADELAKSLTEKPS